MEALDRVWLELAPTLRKLDRLAAEPELIVRAELPRLQHRLHRAAEHAGWLASSAGQPAPHGELAIALAAARDATALVGGALESGGHAAVEPLVWEWRGALFAVRLAQRRLPPHAALSSTAPPEGEQLRRPLGVAAIVLMAAALALVLVVLASLPFSQ